MKKMAYQSMSPLGSALGALTKRKVFVSYHHALDQAYYNYLTTTFADTYEVFSDNSLDRKIESENSEYIRWKIYQDNIKGSSCTIVILGAQTPDRKYVD